MKQFIWTVALAGLIAAPAVANPGKEQFAAILGVDADRYTMSELIRLDNAISENDQTKVRWILSGGMKADSPEAPARVTRSEVQLAGPLGLDPTKYTTAELTKLYAQTLAD